jgi:hypothetical protein
MVTLRCTRRLLKHLGVRPMSELQPPTTTLGDWYANLLFTRRRRLIICVSERTLLSVLVLAKDPTTLPNRFRDAVLALLRQLGVPGAQLEAEAREMKAVAFGTTASQRVLGSMNDLVSQCRWRLKDSPDIDSGTLALELSEIPCGPLSYRYPREVALEMFGAV